MTMKPTEFLRRDYYQMNLHSKHSIEEIEVYLINKKLSWLLSLDVDDPNERQDLFEGLYGVRSTMERIRLHSSITEQEKRRPGEVPDEIRAPFQTIVRWDEEEQ